MARCPRWRFDRGKKPWWTESRHHRMTKKLNILATPSIATHTTIILITKKRKIRMHPPCLKWRKPALSHMRENSISRKHHGRCHRAMSGFRTSFEFGLNFELRLCWAWGTRTNSFCIILGSQFQKARDRLNVILPLDRDSTLVTITSRTRCLLCSNYVKYNWPNWWVRDKLYPISHVYVTPRVSINPKIWYIVHEW